MPELVMEMNGHWKMLVMDITISKTSWAIIGLIMTIQLIGLCPARQIKIGL